MQISFIIDSSVTPDSLRALLAVAKEFDTVPAIQPRAIPVNSSLTKGPMEKEYEKLTGRGIRSALKGQERENFIATRIAMLNAGVSMPGESDGPGEGETFQSDSSVDLSNADFDFDD